MTTKTIPPFVRSDYDESMYFRHDAHKNADKAMPVLTVDTHVGDLECEGANSEIANFKRELEAIYGPVKLQRMEYKHCGVDYAQKKDFSAVKFSQKRFVGSRCSTTP